MSEGFKFTINPEESNEIGIGNYPKGHECVFLIKTVLVENDDAKLTFQASEIEKVGGNIAIPNNLNGASPMYKAGMGALDKNKAVFTRPTIEPYVS